MSSSITDQGVACTVSRQYTGVAPTVARADDVSATIYRRFVRISQAFGIDDSDVLITDSTIDITDTER